MDLDRVAGVQTTYTRNSDISGTAPNNRCLVVGLMLPGGLASPGVPFLAQSLAQVAVQCGGQAAHAVRLYRAARAQRRSAEIWVLPLTEASGGTRATRLLTFTAAPVWANSRWELGSNTAASQGTQCYIDVAGQVATFAIALGDSFAVIGAAAIAALQKITDLIVTPSGNATVTLTDVHKALLGEDLPVRVWFSNPSCGLGVIHGTLTLATNATGDGAISLTDGIGTGAATPGAGNTPAVFAPTLAAALNTANLTVLAVVPATPTGAISLFHRQDRWVRRFTAASADTTTTATLATGTLGAGLPTLTGTPGPLSYNTGDKAYKAWAMPFADTASLGAVASQIITQDKTPIEKGQLVFTAISSALPNSPLPLATTPALATTDLFSVLYAQGSCVRAGEIAARVAAEVAGENDHGRNYNGLVLASTGDMPLAVPNRADASNRDQWNAAIGQGYAPVAVSDGNQFYITNCCTTFASGGNPVLEKSTKWSGALLPIYFRADLRRVLQAAFMAPGNGKSIKAHGVPHTSRGTNANGVRAVVLGQIKIWDNLDYYDYAPDIAAAVRPETTDSPLQIVVAVPFRQVGDLDKIGIDAAPYP